MSPTSEAPATEAPAVTEQAETSQVKAEQAKPEQAKTPQTAGSSQAETEVGPAKAEAAPEQPAKRGRKPSTARKTRTVELTLTVTGTMDGEWQADLSHSGSRVVQGLQIPAAAVSRAAAELHEDISKAIESVLDVARQQHQARLAELEAELSKVKQALAELQDS